MKKIYEKMICMMSKICLRILLIIFIILIISMVTKFKENLAAFAEKVENISKQDINNNYELVEIKLESEYITAVNNLNNDLYPDGWVEDFNEKIIELQKIFPTGTYWNHMGNNPMNPGETNSIYSVTDMPCNHNFYGEWYCNAYYGKSDEVYPYESTSVQCRGFASMLSDMIFGEDADVYVFEDYDKLRIGDQARIDGDFHSVFIIDKTDDYVIVAECNSDLQTCQIQWGRKILRKDMAGWYITRWNN